MRAVMQTLDDWLAHCERLHPKHIELGLERVRAVAERMGTTKSAISRLESAGRHAPSLATLKRYALAVGCDLQVKLVPHKAP